MSAHRTHACAYRYLRRKAGESRWIVVTTIFAPTDCIKFLSKLDDWNLVRAALSVGRSRSHAPARLQVVVGDKKTPDPWTTPDKWPIPPNVHYLSPARQLELGFKIIPLLPWANYGRKNIGFLYAIQQGGAFVRQEAARLGTCAR